MEHVPIMICDALNAFIAAAAEPCVFEPGQTPLPLEAGSYSLDVMGGRVVLQVWARDTNLVRRITAVQKQTGAGIEVSVELFGKRTGTLHFVDRANRKSEKATGKAARLVFREYFRRLLTRHYAGWRIRDLSTEADLEHSLSPAYCRAFLTKGTSGWAAIGAGQGSADPDGVLTFGLIWLDYLRRREPRIAVEGLIVVVPEGAEKTTCLRIRHLDPAMAGYAVFVYAEGWEQRIDISDVGNLDTCLPVRETRIELPEWIESLGSLPDVERIDFGRDHLSWRVRGYEFARWDGKVLRFGLETRHTATASNRSEIAALAAELARIRTSESRCVDNRLYSAYPERWLESQIRTSLPALDAWIQPAPVYGQVPSFAASQRGVIDMLACGCDGRLAVVEVKASEDVHLPLQALDYWMRVAWHAADGSFRPRGYFPGVSLSPRPPKLFLVAPALAFHPATDVVLRFFRPDVEVVRVGVSMNWRHELKVVSRRSAGCEYREGD